MSSRSAYLQARSCLAVLLLMPSLACFSDDPDVNDDGVVDILDVSLVSSCIGEAPAEGNLCAVADLDGDGDVDEDDLSRVVEAFGESGFPTAPQIAISSPAPGSLFTTTPIELTGELSGPQATELIVDGQGVAFDADGGFTTGVDLLEGRNTISVTAINGIGRAGIASVQVTLDTQPPRVTVASPLEGLRTSDETISVSGGINDIVAGTAGGDPSSVTVNGVAAAVQNRSYLAPGVPLALGANMITVEGVDRAGNRGQASIMVTREARPMGEPEIRIVSGNDQQATVKAPLGEPLVVELLDAAGAPAAGQTVVFRVVENDGTLRSGLPSARSVALVTDEAGRAEAHWTLGGRAGAGNQRVDVASVGFQGMAMFTAIALPEPPARIVVDSGNSQTGLLNQPLAHPFTVAVTDQHANRLADVEVRFEVEAGFGNLAGALSQTLMTDGEGRAQTTLTLGPSAGSGLNLVTANFAGNQPDESGNFPLSYPASFLASGVDPGLAGDTGVVGVVLDDTDRPIPGVAVCVAVRKAPSECVSGLETQTSEAGRFEILGAPVGTIQLLADGNNPSRDALRWPRLSFELVTLPGVENTLGMPIYLLPLQPDEAGLFVDATRGGTLSLPELPGFSLMVEPGSATFSDGSDRGTLTVTLVHADKVPMVPSFGQQPRFIVTIQPSGTSFDPPAALTIPNTEGLQPGETTELYSFAHDLGQFVTIGTGTVSEDGLVIASDPGVGVLAAGWHSGGNPSRSGTVAVCPQCFRSVVNMCVPEPEPCTPVPEPSTATLYASALAALAGLARHARRNRRK